MKPFNRFRFLILVSTGAGCTQPTPRPVPPAPLPAAESIEHSVFLIGDAGVPQQPIDPVLKALGAALAERPTRSTVIFLGDNIYPKGLPPESNPYRTEAEFRLQSQMDVVPLEARGIFVMGNHDWAGGGRDGWATAARQSAFLKASARSDIVALPGNGCPGPVVVDPTQTFRLVLLDTQWWLQDHDPTDPELPDCVLVTKAQVSDSIRSIVATRGDRLILAAGHHPLESGGRHGGYFTWSDHVFPLRFIHPALWLPLPIIGSVYPLARRSGITNQDMSGRRNREMRDSLESAFGDNVLLYASGHEHNLQVLERNKGYLAISGAGEFGNGTPVRHRANTLFARRGGGFIRVDILMDGRVRLAALLVDNDGGMTEDFSMWLARS